MHKKRKTFPLNLVEGFHQLRVKNSNIISKIFCENWLDEENCLFIEAFQEGVLKSKEPHKNLGIYDFPF